MSVTSRSPSDGSAPLQLPVSESASVILAVASIDGGGACASSSPHVASTLKLTSQNRMLKVASPLACHGEGPSSRRSSEIPNRLSPSYFRAIPALTSTEK